MSITRNLPTDLTWLSKLMERCQLPTYAAGMCFGLAAMAMQYGLAEGSVEALQEQLWLLIDLFQHPEQPVTDAVSAFLTGIAIFQLPNAFKDRLPATDSYEQSLSLCKQVTACEKITAQGGMTVINRFIDAYTLEELSSHYNELKNAVEKNNTSKPIFLLLRNIGHAITVGYNPETQQWFCIDLNTMNRSRVAPIDYYADARVLAKKIFAAFQSSKTAIFSSELCSTENQAADVRAIVTAWRQASPLKITPDYAKRIDNHGTSILLLATVVNDIKTVREQLAMGADVNQALHHSNKTPLFLAAQSGYIKLTRTLLQHNAKTNIVTSEGFTPLIAAICENHHKVVNVLLNSNMVDPEMKTRDGLTPLDFAANQKSKTLVQLLLDAGANPKNVCHEDTPAILEKLKKQHGISQLFGSPRSLRELAMTISATTPTTSPN